MRIQIVSTRLAYLVYELYQMLLMNMEQRVSLHVVLCIYTHYLSSRPKQDSARGYLGGKGLDREGVQGFANASPISWPPFHARIHHALFNSSNRR
jgi:hypothetical protein